MARSVVATPSSLENKETKTINVCIIVIIYIHTNIYTGAAGNNAGRSWVKMADMNKSHDDVQYYES